MAISKIGLGTDADDRTGFDLRAGGTEINKLIPVAGDIDTYAISARDELIKTADLDIALQWQFSDSTIDSDPGLGFFRLNNSDLSLATFIFLSNSERHGLDVSLGINLIQINSRELIKKHTSLTDIVVIKVKDDPIKETGYIKIPIQVTALSPGTSFDEGDICTFSFADQRELNDVVIINSLADFPNDPDGSGFIEIGGVGTVMTYRFHAGDVDISPYKLKQTGGFVVIEGSNRYTSTLTSDTTSPLITVIDGLYADEKMNFSNPNGPIYDYDATGVAQSAFVSVNAVIRDCTTIGTIDDANTISLRTMSIADTSVGGLTVSGANQLQFNISNMLGFVWAGTLIDLGTSTWDIINFGSNSRWISPVGTTILSGLASNGNLTATGRGLVDGNLFNGSGTALSGIDTNDIQWSFKDNIFVDNSTKNSRTDADGFMLTLEAVTNIGADTFGAIGGTNWASDIANRFTVSTAGLFTYIGLPSIEVSISAAATVEKSGGGAALICTKIAIDTGSGLAVVDKTIGCTENSTSTQISSAGLFTLDNGDSFQLFVSIDDTSVINVSNARMIVAGA